MTIIPEDLANGQSIYDGTTSIYAMDDASDNIVGGSYSHNAKQWSANAAAQLRDFANYIRQGTVIGNALSIRGVTVANAATTPADQNILKYNIASGEWELAADSADWANPGSIGSTTPNSGAFTTLSSTGAVSPNSLTIGGNNVTDILISSDVSSASDSDLITAGYIDANNKSYPDDFSGCVLERQSITVVEAAGSVYLDMEKEGGGDLTVRIDGVEYTLDCTTGAGVGGKARTQLFQGTSSTPSYNYVYVDIVAGAAVLTASTSYPVPTGVGFAFAAYITIQSSVEVAAEGTLLSQRTTDAVSHDGRGRTSYIDEKLRVRRGELGQWNIADIDHHAERGRSGSGRPGHDSRYYVPAASAVYSCLLICRRWHLGG